MTTIAWDGRTLAADRLSTNDGCRMGQATKVRRMPDGRLAACAGAATRCMAYFAWLTDKTQPRPAWQDSTETSVHALEILLDGTLLRHEEHGSYELEGNRAALGSGASYALAAMACGKGAADAVRVAALFDVWTGSDVDALVLDLDCDDARPA